jgi:hypothetical protein
MKPINENKMKYFHKDPDLILKDSSSPAGATRERCVSDSNLVIPSIVARIGWRF